MKLTRHSGSFRFFVKISKFLHPWILSRFLRHESLVFQNPRDSPIGIRCSMEPRYCYPWAYAGAFFVLPLDLCIIVLKNESAFSYSSPSWAYISLQLLTCTRAHIYAPPAGIPREDIRIRGRRDIWKGWGWGFNIVRTFQSVYDCIDSTDPACRHLAEVSNHCTPSSPGLSNARSSDLSRGKI